MRVDINGIATFASVLISCPLCRVAPLMRLKLGADHNAFFPRIGTLAMAADRQLDNRIIQLIRAWEAVHFAKYNYFYGVVCVVAIALVVLYGGPHSN